MLTKKIIDNAQPKRVNGTPKEFFLKDGGGLYLIVTPKGGKIWRYHFSFKNKKYKISLGSYPYVTIKEARKRLYEAKVQKAMGINPVVARREEKAFERLKDKQTFSLISNEYFSKRSNEIKGNTLIKQKQLIERDFIPYIGKKTMATITRKDIVNVAQRIQDRGAIDTAHRAINLCKQIFRFALQKGTIERNDIASINSSDILIKAKKNNMKTLVDDKSIKDLMRFIKEIENEAVSDALLLMAFTGARTSNIIRAGWRFIDLEKKIWTIPPSQMKSGLEHVVYLNDCAMKILERRKKESESVFVFPSARRTLGHMAENSLSVALKTRYKGVFTPHGFRAMLSTLAYESGKFRTEVIEAVLAHRDNNKVRSIYNRADYEKERKELMKWWCSRISF